MTTANEIIIRALRKINVGAQGDPIDADMMAEGLTALNSMIHAWKLASVDTEHADLDYGTAFPLDPEYEEGTVYLLASRISPDYTVPPLFDADDWFRKFQAALCEIEDVPMPGGLAFLPSQRTRRWS